MSMTPSSSSSPYITVEQFLARKDWRTVAQLVMDDGTQASEASLLTNPRLEIILMDASGEVESALVASMRYTAADLQSANGIASAYLQGIVADVAMWKLFDRRLGGEIPESVTEAYLQAWKKIDKLKSGETILPFTEVQEAGLPTNEFPDINELKNLNLFSDRCSRTLGVRNQFRRGRF